MVEKQTQIISIHPTRPEPHLIAQATAVIQAGGLVAFPTETVYGLGADALNDTAVQKIFTAKQRPAYDPIIAHINHIDQLDQLAINVPDSAALLAEKFWPGPLTFILPKAEHVPSRLTAGGPTVAVRCPSHPIARALIQAAQTPIGAPSANRFSHTSPTSAQHVWDDLNGRIELILDGGPAHIGVESTVLDLTQAVPTILRPGGITFEMLTAVLPHVRPHQPNPKKSQKEVQISPGLLERHYAPSTPLWLVTGHNQEIYQKIRQTVANHPDKKFGLMIANEDLAELQTTASQIGIVGSLNDLEEVASQLFQTMRQLETHPLDFILARSYPTQGIGAAIQDRLRRAADKVF
ncbi:MAG: L-threonylcarbamoyladenylate synthase [Chloroflexota bacterium]